MPTGATVYVSDADFDKEVLQSAEPVLVDFYAEWCGPCKAMAPALEQVAADLKGKVKIAKLDVDQSPAVTQQYRIQAMPTLMIFKGGQVAAQRVGALTQKKQLTDWINGSI
jgi:thioredoxin 1